MTTLVLERIAEIVDAPADDHWERVKPPRELPVLTEHQASRLRRTAGMEPFSPPEGFVSLR